MWLEKRYQKIRIYKGWLWLILLFLTLCIFGKGIVEEYAMHKAQMYLTWADQAKSQEEKMNNVKKALLWSPGLAEIYQLITEKWIFADSFSTTDFMKMLTTLEEEGALEELKFQNPTAYAEFTYKIGIFFFYDCERNHGRQEASIWFRRSLEMEKRLGKKERKMLLAWIAIGESNLDTMTYFQALHSLNTSFITNKMSQADYNRAYQIALGILSDLRGYCKIFLEENDLQAKDLYYEVLQAERIGKDFRYEMKQKQKEQLTLLAADTRKRIRIMEEIHEKEE